MSKSQPTDVPTSTNLPGLGHPIAVVAERTGLSRDVLRVWERRYRAVEPMRSAGGQRVYSDQQIERFRLLAAATRHGRTIGLVATLSNAQLTQLIEDDVIAAKSLETVTPKPTAVLLPPTRHSPPHARDAKRSEHLSEIVDAAMAYTMAYDGASVERLFRRSIAEFGLLCVLDEVIPPFMIRIGEEWVEHQLSIAHEHLASAAVMSVLFDAMRAGQEKADAPRILIATPAGERHGIGAALVAATASLDGWTVVHLGVDVPASEICAAAEAVNASVVALSAVYVEDPTHLAREVALIREALASSVSLVVGGSAALGHSEVLKAPGVTMCTSLDALRQELSHCYST